MSLTTLDPKTALIVVDLQGSGLPAVPVPWDRVVSNARLLADKFRALGLPVVLVNVAGTAPGRKEIQGSSSKPRPPGWTELVPELNPQASDHLVTKHTWGAFRNTDLEEYLRSQGVTQVVIAGCATSVGADTTAREAYSCGFNVTFALDATTDVDADSYAHCVTRIFPRMGETGTTAEIIELLEKTHP